MPPGAAAVLVYDAQAGILPHVQDGDGLVERIGRILAAARAAGVPVFYCRHVSLPPTHLGVGALRTAMAWQRQEQADAVISPFPPDAAQTAIVDELGARAAASRCSTSSGCPRWSARRWRRRCATAA